MLEPVQQEECSFQFAQFTQCGGEAVLAGIGAELAHHQVGGHGAGLDGCGQAEDFIPVLGDGLHVDDVADQRRQGGKLWIDTGHREGLALDTRRIHKLPL